MVGRVDVTWISLEFQDRLYRDLIFARAKIPKGLVYVGDVSEGNFSKDSFNE